MARLKLGVLISGRGSNLQALIDASENPDFPAEIAVVISNVANAAGLERAKQAGIPTLVVPHKEYPSREEFEQALHDALKEFDVELVCLAGFMRILNVLPGWWGGKMINIHPSLLPAYPGLDTHRRAIEAGDLYAGCTVHFVDDGVDTGPIIVRAKVPIQPGDTEEILAARVLGGEHKIYPLAVQLIADGDVAYKEGEIFRTDKGKAALESGT
jgi:phosphoribosylglycinamide formyltransferase 1